jgi:hypothetical protein
MDVPLDPDAVTETEHDDAPLEPPEPDEPESPPCDPVEED